MGAHLIDGRFKSDKYAMVPAGLLPLSFKDPAAQPLIAAYSRRRRNGSHGSKEVDVEFADDVDEALRIQGYTGGPWDSDAERAAVIAYVCQIDYLSAVDAEQLAEDLRTGEHLGPNTPPLPDVPAALVILKGLLATEDGKRHHHDGNVTTLAFTCSRGHSFSRKRYGSCWCGWHGRPR